MHPRYCRPRALLGGGVLLALLLTVTPPGSAQEAAKGPVLIVPIGGTVNLQMSTKKPIKKVSVPKEGVISVRTIFNDPTTVLVTGLMPDVVRVTLTDADDKTETYDVLVQLDIEYLRTQLKRAVPTSNIVPIPTSGNSVILTGYVQQAEDIEIALQVARGIGGVNVINALRAGGVQQVQLDVVIAQVSRSEMRRFAFDFLTDSRNFFLGSTVGQAVVNPPLVGVGSSQLTVNGVLSGVPGAPNGAPTNFLFGILHTRWGFLGFLQALRDEGLVKLLSEPRITTLSGRPASFLVGGEQAIPVPAGLGQIGVQFEEFGTRLNVLPIVQGDGRIYLEIEPEVSSLNASNGVSIQGTVVPGRDTNRINTTAIIEAGQTLVLGGLIQHVVSGTIEKVPVLGDLPFLGTAFSSKLYQESETETIVMVTPHLVDPMDCSQAPKILPGQETRSPDDFELFLEGIMEAPRGPRQVFQGCHYVPAYKNGPTAGTIPCAGGAGSGGPGCGGPGCGGPGCGAPGGPVAPPAPPAPLPPGMPLVPTAAPVSRPLSQAPPARLAGPATVPAAAPPAPAVAPEPERPTTLPPAPPGPFEPPATEGPPQP